MRPGTVKSRTSRALERLREEVTAMTDLERALLELDVEWPATPDLATAVMTRIAAEPRTPADRARRVKLRGFARLAGAGGVRRGGAGRARAAARSRSRPTRARRSCAGSGSRAWRSGASRRGRGAGRDAEPRHADARCPPRRAASRARSATPDAVYATPLPDGRTVRRSSTAGRRWCSCRPSARPRRRSSRRPSAPPTTSSGSRSTARPRTGSRRARVRVRRAERASSTRTSASSDRVLLVERGGVLLPRRGRDQPRPRRRDRPLS